MDRRVLDYVMRKSEQDYRDERRRRGRSGRYIRDRRDEYDERDERDYEDRRRDRRDYEDARDYEDSRDYEDGHYEMRLRKSDIKEWKHRLENADGTRGEHFDMQQILQAAERLNIKFKDYDEKEFCLTVNVMYADYCKVIRKHISEDKELMFCAEMAKAFLEDVDGPEASEKLALYYYCIVKYEPV